jgi:DNA-binding NarL/FixJ family response regulator
MRMKHSNQEEKPESLGPDSTEDAVIAAILRELQPLHRAYCLTLDVRSCQILDCLLMGMTYVQISKALFISIDTVRVGARKIYAALECDHTSLRQTCKDAGWHRPF